MKSASSIITLARERTNNTTYSSNSGISQSLAVEFLNDGQSLLQTAIINQYPQEFVSEYTFNVVGNQETYALPERAFGGGRIIAIYYSNSGYDRDYERLRPRSLLERDMRECGYPLYYIRANGTVYLNPIPNSSQGTVKVLYYKELDTLDVSKGVVTSQAGSTLTFSGGHTITLADEYVSVCSSLGDPILYAGQIASVTATTIVLTNALTTYLVEGKVATDLVNGVVVAGKYATTHSTLPNICEKYLRTYLQKRLLTRDSDNGNITEDVELKEQLANILNTYSQPTEDVYGITILDPWSL